MDKKEHINCQYFDFLQAAYDTPSLRAYLELINFKIQRQCTKESKFYIGIKIFDIQDDQEIQGAGIYICNEHLIIVRSMIIKTLMQKHNLSQSEALANIEVLKFK